MHPIVELPRDGLDPVEVKMPDAPAYVVMTDMISSIIVGKKVVNVFPTVGRAQAKLILAHATANANQQDPRITAVAPEPRDDEVLVVMPGHYVRLWAEYGGLRTVARQKARRLRLDQRGVSRKKRPGNRGHVNS